MKFRLLIFFILIGQFGFTQHIEEIRRALYPEFNPVSWSANYTMDQDYEPEDYSTWDWAPKAPEFQSAFTGYYILERFLRKRNNEITAKFDEAGKAAFWNAHRKWEKTVKENCEHIWKAGEVGYSMMVLNYLYCINSAFRDHVNKLGGGIPPNAKLDAMHGWDKYRIGESIRQYPGLVKNAVSGTDHSYSDPDSVLIKGYKAAVTLGFQEEKLQTIVLRFQKCYCESVISNMLEEKFGNPTRETEIIMEYSISKWKGKEISLEYFEATGSASITIKAIAGGPKR